MYHSYEDNVSYCLEQARSDCVFGRYWLHSGKILDSLGFIKSAIFWLDRLEVYLHSNREVNEK